MAETPTSEQEHAVEGAKKGQSMRISAFAGSGKTSTLRMISKAISDKKITYLAFNKAIATEAQNKFPRNVSACTFHSLAYKGVDKNITKNVFSHRWMPKEMALYFDLRKLRVPLQLKPQMSADLNPVDQAFIIQNAVNNFCRSNSEEISLLNVLDAIPEWVEQNSAMELSRLLRPRAIDLWNLCTSPEFHYKISHDVYLKLWSMSKPVIPGDFIFLDEAQDADGIMLQILANQPSPTAYVGDRHQSIYGFRGAINAMQKINATEYRLTKSFRFGQTIADQANMILKNLLGESVPIIGNELIDSKVQTLEQPDAFLVRTNIEAFKIILRLLELGRSPRAEMDIASLKQDIQDCLKLMEDVPVSRASNFFGFNDWEEAIEHVKFNPHSDLKPLVTLASRNDPKVLLAALDRVSRDKGDCVVSTAHKSKGLEFGKVYLHGDFKWDKTAVELHKPLATEAESRLIYVAATRAINGLDRGGMTEFFDHLRKIEESRVRFVRKRR